MSLFGVPAISSYQYSGYAKDKGKSNEKISGNIAQIQNAAAGYGCGAQNGNDCEEGHHNAYDFAKYLFHIVI